MRPMMLGTRIVRIATEHCADLFGLAGMMQVLVPASAQVGFIDTP